LELEKEFLSPVEEAYLIGVRYFFHLAQYLYLSSQEEQGVAPVSVGDEISFYWDYGLLLPEDGEA
jgi:hypothetical protein